MQHYSFCDGGDKCRCEFIRETAAELMALEARLISEGVMAYFPDPKAQEAHHG